MLRTRGELERARSGALERRRSAALGLRSGLDARLGVLRRTGSPVTGRRASGGRRWAALVERTSAAGARWAGTSRALVIRRMPESRVAFGGGAARSAGTADGG